MLSLLYPHCSLALAHKHNPTLYPIWLTFATTLSSFASVASRWLGILCHCHPQLCLDLLLFPCIKPPVYVLPLDVADFPIQKVLCFVVLRLFITNALCLAFIPQLLYVLFPYLEFNALLGSAAFRISVFTPVLI